MDDGALTLPIVKIELVLVIPYIVGWAKDGAVYIIPVSTAPSNSRFMLIVLM